MERDDKRLPLGAAVMWINARRRGERGHVVEVATTHATVVREDGARLRLRWGDLLAEDRAPQRTIVTDFDRAQVRFEVGDVVVFTARGGSTMLGTVEKLNPKRARVRCAQSRWNVPYVVLRHWEAPARDRGGERLDEVAKEARALMDAHGLEEWTFRFAASQRRLGACLAQPKINVVPAHHTAQAYVDAYLEAAGIADDRRGPLFRPCPPGRNDALLDRPMTRVTALKMIKRRAHQTGLPREICAHSFRGTGITEYLRNGGDLEVAARIAGHESTRTTQLYNRLQEEIPLDEIERIHI